MENLQLSLAEIMTKAEIATWKLHDRKTPVALMLAMARLYELTYPISFDDAVSILDPWLSAVWWHDVAETAEDAGDQEIADVYWEKVRNGLRQHYILLVEQLGVEADGVQIAYHDFERWQAHHRRQFESYVHHDAAMTAMLMGMTYDEAKEIAYIRGDAVWVHNDTHLETGVTQEEALRLWYKAQDTLLAYYEGFVKYAKLEKPSILKPVAEGRSVSVSLPSLPN